MHKLMVIVFARQACTCAQSLFLQGKPAHVHNLARAFADCQLDVLKHRTDRTKIRNMLPIEYVHTSVFEKV